MAGEKPAPTKEADRKSIATNVWDCSEHCVLFNCRRNRVAEIWHKVFAGQANTYVSKFAGRHTFLEHSPISSYLCLCLLKPVHIISGNEVSMKPCSCILIFQAIRPANGFHQVPTQTIRAPSLMQTAGNPLSGATVLLLNWDKGIITDFTSTGLPPGRCSGRAVSVEARHGP